MKNNRPTGGEPITVNVTLTLDQWSTVFLLIRQSLVMLPSPNWDSSEEILDTLEAAVSKSFSASTSN